MNVEEAQAHLDTMLPQLSLSKLQIEIFRAVWAEQSYHQIARHCGYGLSHIKQTGSELWQLLSQGLGEKVTKGNVKTVFKRYVHRSLEGQPRIHPLVTHEVRAVACHPNGELLVSAGFDGRIRLWDARSGACLASTETSGAKIYALAISADGTSLACGSDRTLEIWHLTDPPAPTLHRQHTLSANTSPIRGVAFSADSTLLASGGDDPTIRIWETSTGQCLRLLQGHTSWVSSLAFAPHSALLASGSEDQSVRLWNSHTAACLHNLQGYSNGIWSVAYSPQGQQFVSGGQDRTVRLWDSATGRCLQAMTGHKSWVWSVAFCAQGQILASSSDDRSIRIWNTQGRCRHQLQGHTDQVYSIAFRPVSTPNEPPCLASGSLDGTIRLWNPDSGECQEILAGHSNGVWSVAFHPQGTLLASGSLDQTVKLWHLSPPPHPSPARSSRLRQTLTGHRSWVRCVTFSPDGHLLASASADGCLNIWGVQTGQLLHTIQAHPSAILCIGFSPDGSTLASSGVDTTIKIRNLKRLEQSGGILAEQPNPPRLTQSQILKTLVGHEKWIRCLAYSPDGLNLISCSQDETIRLWQVETGECLQTLRMPRPYEGLNIRNIQGLSSAQQTVLKNLGAKT
jgi:WD40 repeat protein